MIIRVDELEHPFYSFGVPSPSPQVTAALATLQARWGGAAPRALVDAEAMPTVGALAAVPLYEPERVPPADEGRVVSTGFAGLDAILGPGGLPRIASVAMVYNPLNPVDEEAIVAIEATAKALNVRIERLAVRAPADFETVLFALTRQRVDAVTVVEDPMIQSQSLRVVEAALREKVPTVFSLPNYVAAGGLMSYAPNRPDLWRRAARLTDKILRGAKPGDLPVEQASTFELVINLKTAKALGLTIPPALLSRADQVIE